MGTWLPETCRDLEINIHDKELCVKLVIYKVYTEMHGQQNIKSFTLTTQLLTCICLFSGGYIPYDLVSRAVPYRDVTPGTLTATDTSIVYHVKHFVGGGGGVRKQ
jgi:hypothetical protein